MYVNPALSALKGYHLTSTIRYPRLFSYLAYGLIFLAAFLFPLLLALLKQDLFPGVADDLVMWISALAIPTAMFVRLEIQIGVSRWLGYKIPNLWFVPFRPETYTGDAGQFQKQRHVFCFAVAPVSVFLLLSLLLLIHLIRLPEAVGDAFALYLFLSLIWTLGDLYLLWQLLRVPRKALLYRLRPQELLIFEPEG